MLINLTLFPFTFRFCRFVFHLQFFFFRLTGHFFADSFKYCKSLISRHFLSRLGGESKTFKVLLNIIDIFRSFGAKATIKTISYFKNSKKFLITFLECLSCLGVAAGVDGDVGCSTPFDPGVVIFTNLNSLQ